MKWHIVLKGVFDDPNNPTEEDPSKPLKPRYRDILADEVLEDNTPTSGGSQTGKVTENKPNKDICDGFPGCRKISELRCSVCKTSYCATCWPKFEEFGHPSEPYKLGDNDNDEDVQLED